MSFSDYIHQFIHAYWYYIVAYELVCAALSGFIADSKERKFPNWFVLGLLFGVFSVIAALAIPSLSDEGAPVDNVLLDLQHRLRSGWRIVLFLVTVIVLYYLSAVIAESTRVVPPQSLFFLFYIDVALATFLILKFVDRRKFTSVGLPYHGKIMKEILLGFLIGSVMIGLVGGFELAVGALKLNLRAGTNLVLLARNFGLSFLFFGYFAMGEELIFRGYPYQALIEGMGSVGATIFMSIVFGLMHLLNPSANVFSTINTMLAGAWLSIAYLKKRTLYFPFGMHFSWNLVQSFFLSLPVSGLLTNRTIFIPTDYGPDWLTGGRYGPEAGVGTTVIMVVGILFLLLGKRLKPTYDYLSSKERLSSGTENSVK